MDQTEKNKVLFMHLVLSLHSATMQQLGKLKNPLTDKLERDLPGAQGSIDMLEMIKAVTRGNLASEEQRFLDQVLQELRLNYVDEAGKPEASGAGEQPSSGEQKA